MIEKKICKICSKEFVPDKYHPRQRVCSSKECQNARQMKNQRVWRSNNPNYFKYKDKKTPWELRRYNYLKKWRQDHRGYFKSYRKKIKKQKFA
ncbi:MAG: hypothetical protein JW734_02140 [Candidatus Omnitrophica bacterium]|nr:hypothetical protein [Candidatus Omnitrophota bacterium]